jgi:hypothetical protein
LRLLNHQRNPLQNEHQQKTDTRRWMDVVVEFACQLSALLGFFSSLESLATNQMVKPSSGYFNKLNQQ